MDDNDLPVWLNTKEAANYLNSTPSTLSDWRVKGKGPAFSKLGERLVRYRKADLDAWMARA